MIRLLRQPTLETCGQTCVAMLTGETVEGVCARLGHDGPTSTDDLLSLLSGHGWVLGGWKKPEALFGMHPLGIALHGGRGFSHAAVWAEGAYLCPLYGECPPDEYAAYWTRKRMGLLMFLGLSSVS